MTAYFPNEFDTFVNKMKADGVEPNVYGDDDAYLRCSQLFFTMRWQSVHRTINGMMKARRALQLLMQAELTPQQRQLAEALLLQKYTCLAAIQPYSTFKDWEKAEVEAMLAPFPQGLNVAYIDADKWPGKKATERRKYFSCLIDSASPECALQNGSRKPKFRVELPGPPILGDGKGDNQNHAIIFSRGSIVQAIDCNQDGYLEEGLKLCCALREFEPPSRRRPGEPRGIAGATTGPAIVGFREHIFSGIGALGKFAATSELVFGTLVQRTMADLLWSRYHYGHPDMLDKCCMMAQGGVSKATKALNLSEDIFAGMDATLRGHTIIHRSYYQVGKGRDLGFTSILGFFSKLSGGTASMSTSRQAWRLSTRLSFSRALGYYYAHLGSCMPN